MEGAINALTNKYISAVSIELDSSYQFPKEEIWYADTNEIQDYNKEKVKDITKIEVRYRKGNESVINWKGTEYAISPCFFIPNKTELGINLIPESREHKLAKNWVYNRIKNQSLIFQYSTAVRPFDYANQINIKELNVDYNKVGIEVTIKNNKVQRADVIIPFKEFHLLFGTGIVIEIQFSKQLEQTTEKRNNEWAFKGYSICWLWIDDFKNISEEIIELKEDKLIIEPLPKILHEFKDKSERDMRLNVQEISRMIDEKLKSYNKETELNEDYLDSYKTIKVQELEKEVSELINQLKTREANLIKALSNIEKEPLKELYSLYERKLKDDQEILSKKLQDKSDSLDTIWKEKMKELNYPFCIGECKKCYYGYMTKRITKTGKRCYGCSNYPICKHTIWINDTD